MKQFLFLFSYDYTFHSSRDLPFPHNTSGVQEFNANIEQEIIDETDHSTNSQLFQIRYELQFLFL